MGNRTGMTITTGNGWVVERHNYTYNSSNQLTTEMRYENGYTRMLYYTYDADGNRISEVEKNYGRCGMDIRNVTTYKYSVENRLAAVYDGCSLLMASAYDGDGNRVFQLNYNPTNDNWRWGGCWYKWLDDSDWWDDKDLWKDYKDQWEDYKDEWFDWGDWYDDWYDRDDHDDDWDDKDEHGEGDKDGDYKQDDKDKSEDKDRSCDLSVSISSTPDADTCGDGKDNHKDSDKHDGNDWNYDDRNRCDILFPIRDEKDGKGHKFVGDLWYAGTHHNYELIEYINDVNREYTEVLVEDNFGGWNDTSYVYGVDRLSFDYYKGHSGYYLYDGRGSVTSITNEWGFVVQSYRYNANGELTFGEARYDNEYTYNGESYNPNIESQYLRARYYDVVTASFLTEDSYLGDINEPLTLNRYNYCVSSPLNYQDPSGNMPVWLLNALSFAYNTGLYPEQDMAIATMFANGGGIFTGFHEFAQLNLARYLHNNGYGTELEYKVQMALEGGQIINCGEADVIGTLFGANFAWEIKPASYEASGSLRQSTYEQLDGYLAGGLIEGGSVYIDNISFWKDIKMKLYSDTERPGVVYYQFYREQITREGVKVVELSNVDVKNEIKQDVEIAIAIVGTVTAITLIEDAVTAGAGVVDDVPSILGGAAVAKFILGV